MKGYPDKVYPMQQLMRKKGRKFEGKERAQKAIENNERELCEAPMVHAHREGMYVLDTRMFQW